MLQEAEGRNDTAIKQTAEEAVSETYERNPDVLGGATAAALRSAERARSCQLRAAFQKTRQVVFVQRLKKPRRGQKTRRDVFVQRLGKV
jgi:hypothetical protein